MGYGLRAKQIVLFLAFLENKLKIKYRNLYINMAQNTPSTGNSTYNEDSIRSLDWREQIRLRPGHQNAEQS